MAGRNRVVGGRKFLERGGVRRGQVNVMTSLVGDLSGDDGADGADGDDGAAGTQVVTALEAGFDPGAYAAGTVVFLVTSGTIATPTALEYGGKKGDGGGGGFPDPVPIT